MIRIGIVEDDAASAALLTGYLRRFEEESGEELVVTRYTDGSALVAGYRPDFDILLLDIEMPGLDGFAAAEQIRQVDRDVVIVFVTNTPQYAVRGYEVDALSYVLKPVSYFALVRELKRSIARLRQRPAHYLVLTVDGGLVRVNTDDVVYLESAKHRTMVHTVDGKHSVVGPLKGLEAQVDGMGFCRINSGYVVNLRHVVAVQQSSCLVVGGQTLPISRPRKKPFLATLTDYLGASRA
ncbi:LytR/AlgR family response regulator transcription factor [Puerhibacterium puerhi]|uniref:LytR/AlgR family response regulator transcription factor n=1 Tax=Puerhibacterium puerhi TaxID=2692623 RepID=UPI0013582B53|nr:LytTR family DNA-binding domain-containing protein [Puerhibacterium puerhi]